MVNYKYLSLILVGILLINVVSISSIYGSEVVNESSSKEKLNSFINRVLELVNIERAKLNLNPLTLDQDLIKAAQIRSQEITILFEHKRPDHREITTLSSKINGENIAAGELTPEEVMNDWMNSPDHRPLILNPDYKTLGVGYTELQEDPYHAYHSWVQLFGGLTKKQTTTIVYLQKVTSLKASNDINKIKLTWKKQTNLTSNGYQIFRYNSKIKDYSLIKTIYGNKNNYYTNKGLSSATTYKYKVRSFNSVDGIKYPAKFSSTIKITTKPTTPTIKLINEKNKIIIKWNKVSKATGYEIKKSYNNKVYITTKYIKKESTTKFTDYNLKNKKTNYYKIRAYKTVDGEKIYGKYSLAKGVKAK